MCMCVSTINTCCDGDQRLPEQWWHVHVCQQHQHLLRRTSTFARAAVACTCVSATSTSAATDFNVCRSSGGTYMCVSSINICCDGHQRLQEQWWHVILQQHERLLQQCRHVTICSTNAFCGGASMSCSGINAFCSGAITSTAPTFPTNTAAPGSQRIPHNDCNASRHDAETVAVLHATLLFACNISAVCSHVCTQQRCHTL